MSNASKLNELLAKYDETLKDYEALQAEKESLIQAQIPDEVKQRIADIEAEYDPELKAASKAVSGLEKGVKAFIVDKMESVKSTMRHFVFSHGQRKWDNDKLLELAANHPDLYDEIMACRKPKSPIVSVKQL